MNYEKKENDQIAFSLRSVDVCRGDAVPQGEFQGEVGAHDPSCHAGLHYLCIYIEVWHSLVLAQCTEDSVCRTSHTTLQRKECRWDYAALHVVYKECCHVVTNLICYRVAVLECTCLVGQVALHHSHDFLLVIGTENHRRLLPATMLMGSVLALLCNLLCTLPSDGGVIPLNAITPLFGAPVIIYVLIRK